MNQIQNIALSPIVYKNSLLLIKRKKPPYQGYWSLPGGKIEFGEYPQEAIIREIQEETGLIVKTATLRAIISEVLISENSQKEHFFLWLYQTEVSSGKIQESEEGQIGLFPLSKISVILFAKPLPAQL